MKRVALIDADTLIYAAGAANEYETQWEPWLWTLHANFDAAMEQVHRMVDDILKGVKADEIIMVLSDGSENWRKSVMPEYKHNRANKRKPVIHKALRQYVHEQWPSYERPTLEGDDVLGILATHPKLVEGEKVIVSIDKDMLTIPGLYCNYNKDRVEGGAWYIHRVSEDAASWLHMKQTLTGDATDGYSGCPGVGPISSLKVLGLEEGADWPEFHSEQAWPAVVAAYAKKGLSEAVALQNARVARICRHTDYDFKKKEVVLWTPYQT